MSDESDALRSTIARLQEISAELAKGELPAERARELADLAMQLSSEAATQLAEALRHLDGQ